MLLDSDSEVAPLVETLFYVMWKVTNCGDMDFRHLPGPSLLRYIQDLK